MRANLTSGQNPALVDNLKILNHFADEKVVQLRRKVFAEMGVARRSGGSAIRTDVYATSYDCRIAAVPGGEGAFCRSRASIRDLSVEPKRLYLQLSCIERSPER